MNDDAPAAELNDVPRVYLDYGVLARIADGAVAPELVADLVDAVETAAAALIFSHAHLWDLHHATDDGTRQRFYTLLTRFPLVAVDVGPIPIREEERIDELLGTPAESNLQSLPTMDMQLVRVADCSREFERYKSELASLGNVAAMFAAAENTSRSARTGSPATKAMKLVVREFMVRALSGESFVRIRDDMIERALIPLELSEPVGASMSQIDALMPMLADAISAKGGTPEQFVDSFMKDRVMPAVSWAAVHSGAERWERLAPIVAPGIYLGTLVKRRQEKNTGRPARASDLADSNHVHYLPYVDVATVDRDNYPVIEDGLKRVKCRRVARLLRNGDLAGIVAAIRDLVQFRAT